MFERESVPYAPALVESMRSLGYSFESAVADLIDNSVSADAKRIDIIMTVTAKPVLVILDDGRGMDSNKLEEAMRYGSSNPLERRRTNDLGRFGLGLKSASLSQCRRLTVVSKQGRELACFAWDLDHVVETGAWSLLGYDVEEINQIPMIDRLMNLEHGTFVLMEEFDRVAASTSDVHKTLTKYLDITIDHLALVFHRYLTEELDIFVNARKIEARDPFLTKNKATQFKREQSFSIDGTKIILKPYILPHISKLTTNDIRVVGGKEALRSEQGFYVYRNRRLIIWGTWFRLERKDELSKLARVMVDIPNSLDYMWNIDIKKSSATLPDLIKKNLYNCVYESVLNSESVHNYRGRRTNCAEDVNYVWERIQTRDGYQYKINREIPQIQVFRKCLNSEQLKLLSNLVTSIEQSFPSSSMYLDMSKGKLLECEDDDTLKDFNEIMLQIEAAQKLEMDVKALLLAYKKTEPYCKRRDLVDLLDKEIEKYE